MIYLAAGIFLFTIGAMIYIWRESKKCGQNTIENKILKETIDDIHTAKLARDALDSNDDLRDRLREKYERR